MEKYQIHKAALESDYEYALKLINSNVDLDELDTLGCTPLHWAVFRGDIELVKILLEAGANPNTFSSDGITPKWRAQDFGLGEIEVLLQSFGGRVSTNKDFDKRAYTIFNSIIGQPLPENKSEFNEEETVAKAPPKKWWKFW